MSTSTDLRVMIREARHARGWTQTELARVLGVRPETIWRWERGKARPRHDRLETLARVVHKPPDWLFALERDRRPYHRPGTLEPLAARIARTLKELLRV